MRSMDYEAYVRMIINRRWDKVSLSQKGMLIECHRRITWLRNYL